jgi:hypothetical protein
MGQHAGFDNYLCTPNGRIHRLLTRLAVQNLFHPFQPFMFGQKFLGSRRWRRCSTSRWCSTEKTRPSTAIPSPTTGKAERDYALFRHQEADRRSFLAGPPRRN